MIYWFAEFPGQAEIFQFDQRQYQADEIYLQQLIREIDRLGVEQFTLTPDERRCAYCVYRSFCERGVAAGDRNQAGYEVKEDLVSSVDVDFEQISEIAF